MESNSTFTSHKTESHEFKASHDLAIRECCKRNIRRYAVHNPMTVCPECKQVLKVYDDKKALKNYVAFCKSRHREIQIVDFEGKTIVIFQSYNHFSFV